MINKNNSETKEFDPKTTPTFRTVTSNWEGAVNIVNWQNVCSAGVLRSLAKNSFSPPLLTDFFEDCSRLLTHSRYIAVIRGFSQAGPPLWLCILIRLLAVNLAGPFFVQPYRTLTHCFHN